jgi:hypothetical protein
MKVKLIALEKFYATSLMNNCERATSRAERQFLDNETNLAYSEILCALTDLEDIQVKEKVNKDTENFDYLNKCFDEVEPILKKHLPTNELKLAMYYILVLVESSNRDKGKV